MTVHIYYCAHCLKKFSHVHEYQDKTKDDVVCPFCDAESQDLILVHRESWKKTEGVN